MNDHRITSEENENWVARKVSISDALQAKQQQLREELYQSEKAHLIDLLKCSISKAEKAEAALSRVSEQKKALLEQLQDTKQELEFCYQDLEKMNQELCNLFKFVQITPAQAKELAKTLLEQEKSARNALAALLNAIYNLRIKPWELQHRPLPIDYPNPDSINSIGQSSFKPLQFSDEMAKFKADYDKLAAKFAALKAKATRLKGEIKKQS